MYRLTARMRQHFGRDLGKYHELFTGGRCQGWEQEELIVAAIKSDTNAQHHVRWREAGHDDKEDILVRTNGDTHPIQIKSGKLGGGKLVISGHRLGRFDGNFKEITSYLQSKVANIISVAYEHIDDSHGRTHAYKISYVDIALLCDVSSSAWLKKGKQYRQVNSDGVEFSVSPSMSWQVWWKIPDHLIEQEDPIIL